MSERWLKCEIHKGMFSDECAVSYDPAHGRRLSVFVSRSDVRFEGRNGGGELFARPRPGQVRVRTFSEGTRVWAVLPAAEQPCVPVQESDLQSH
ncbi:MAG TPA: hypothetical protein P5572_08775 [Phycisphaerae bacterium]|nr:hypothetical protein [Phycisphaerales bacterium]HRX85098.1 hypothetical protein [Phycisphaerae bacterium]